MNGRQAGRRHIAPSTLLCQCPSSADITARLKRRREQGCNAALLLRLVIAALAARFGHHLAHDAVLAVQPGLPVPQRVQLSQRAAAQVAIQVYSGRLGQLAWGSCRAAQHVVMLGEPSGWRTTPVPKPVPAACRRPARLQRSGGGLLMAHTHPLPRWRTWPGHGRTLGRQRGRGRRGRKSRRLRRAAGPEFRQAGKAMQPQALKRVCVGGWGGARSCVKRGVVRVAASPGTERKRARPLLIAGAGQGSRRAKQVGKACVPGVTSSTVPQTAMRSGLPPSAPLCCASCSSVSCSSGTTCPGDGGRQEQRQVRVGRAEGGAA
jgi:hypothetical protein